MKVKILYTLGEIENCIANKLAGAMESAFCALALREGFMPGNAHLTKVDPECGGLNILRATENTPPDIVIKNNSGFGGANVALVFKRVA